MPDIALCGKHFNRDCPKAARCYRAIAEPCEWGQSYFIPKHPGADCGDFIEAKPKGEKEKA